MYIIIIFYNSSYDDTYVEEFFGTLQDEINILPPINHSVLLGDFNASVGSHMQEIWPLVVVSYGAGEHNERCIKLLQCCAINNLFIENTIFKHKEMQRYTWTSPKRTEM